MDFTSAVATYQNNSFIKHTKWGPSFPVNRDLPDGSKVCANFIESKGGGYIEHPAACETIHR